MARKRNTRISGWGVIGLLVIGAALVQQVWFWVLVAIAAFVFIIFAIVRAHNHTAARAQEEERLRAITISNVDNMHGHEFEEYARKLLIHKGFRVETTKHSGDLGVDLTAESDSRIVSVQIKRQSKPVSRRAVSDAVAGIAQYKCNAAMVITNNYFTRGAKELAKSNGCELVDRNMLTKWIMDFQSKLH